jgi:hypothetical protein
VVLSGGEEAGAQGMRAWLRRHRKELDRETTVVVNVDEVGAGTVRWTSGEGALAARRSHRQLVELCEQIAEDDGADGRFAARRMGVASPRCRSVASGRLAMRPTITGRPTPPPASTSTRSSAPPVSAPS